MENEIIIQDETSGFKWLRLFILPLISGILVIFPTFQYLPVSKEFADFANSMSIISTLIFMLGGFLFLLGIIFGIIYLVTKTLKTVTIIFLFNVVFVIFFGILAGVIEENSYTRCIKNAKPVIAALEDYHDTHQEFPKNLEELVPRYIPEIPKTEIGIAPEYQYIRIPGKVKNCEYNESYELSINFYGSMGSLSKFFYSPCPRSLDNSVIKIREINDWLFLDFDD